MSLKFNQVQGMLKKECQLDSTVAIANVIEGDWVYMADSGDYKVLLPSDLSGVTHHEVYQIWTGIRGPLEWNGGEYGSSYATADQRPDVTAIVRGVVDATTATGYAMQSGQITALYGDYICETDRYTDAGIDINSPLTVKAGRLALASVSGEAIIAVALNNPASGELLKFHRMNCGFVA